MLNELKNQSPLEEKTTWHKQVYLFLYSLFKDAVSSPDYIHVVSYGRMAGE